MKWTSDAYGYVTDGESFFHISDVRFFGRKTDKQLTIYVLYTVLNIAYDSNEDRDGHYDFFVKCKIDYAKAQKDDYVADRVIRGTSLEIQNRLAGALVK